MLRFMEDFGSDSITRAALPGRWDSFSNRDNSLSFSATGGPFGEAALLQSPNFNVGFGNSLDKTAIGNGTQMTTVYMCFWFKLIAANNNGNNGVSICAIGDGGTTQCSLNFTTAGILTVYRGGPVGTSLVAASPNATPFGQWGWLVWKTVLGTGTSGSTEVRWNGNTIIGPTSGLNTANSGVAQANVVRLGSIGGNSNSLTTMSYAIADFMLLDQQGSVNNTFPASSRVYSFLPTSNGTYTQFTPLSGANWQRVSNNPDTGDSSYNYSSTAGNKDTFNHGTIASNVATILGVQSQNINRIDDAGPHTGQNVLYDGTTEVDGPSSAPALAPTYGWIEQIAENNLTSGSPFSVSDINNLQFGYKLVT